MNAANGGDRDIVVTGVIKDEAGVRAIEGLDRISKLQIKDGGANDGTLKYVADNSAVNGASSNVLWAMKLDADAIAAMDPGITSPIIPGNNKEYVTHYEKTSDANLVNYSAQLFLVGNNIANSAMWLANESYVIDNSGSL